jgi:hypothetical protein
LNNGTILVDSKGIEMKLGKKMAGILGQRVDLHAKHRGSVVDTLGYLSFPILFFLFTFETRVIT